jgi:hypothetical protein
MLDEIKKQKKKVEDKYWYLNMIQRLLKMQMESIIPRGYDPIIKNLVTWYKQSQM